MTDKEIKQKTEGNASFRQWSNEIVRKYYSETENNTEVGFFNETIKPFLDLYSNVCDSLGKLKYEIGLMEFKAENYLYQLQSMKDITDLSGNYQMLKKKEKSREFAKYVMDRSVRKANKEYDEREQVHPNLQNELDTLSEILQDYEQNLAKKKESLFVDFHQPPFSH